MKERNLLLEHFRRMQGKAGRYLQPPAGQTSADQRAGFIIDMLEALDGPDQRAAQAWASFDYLTESERTASGEFFGHFVSFKTLCEEFAGFVRASAHLDAIKKLLYYGEDVKKGRYRHTVQGFDGKEAVAAMSYDEESAERAVLILHAVLGICTEAGEIAEHVLKVLLSDNSIDIDDVNLSEEIGDLQWYEAMLARAIGTNFGTIQRQNIEKLRQRFPDKFTTDAANNRDLDGERATLEATQGVDWAKDEAELQGSFEMHSPSKGEPGYRPSRKQSSARMSSLASSVLARTAAGQPMPDVAQLIADARSLAASVLSQDETPGQ